LLVLNCGDPLTLTLRQLLSWRRRAERRRRRQLAELAIAHARVLRAALRVEGLAVEADPPRRRHHAPHASPPYDSSTARHAVDHDAGQSPGRGVPGLHAARYWRHPSSG